MSCPPRIRRAIVPAAGLATRFLPTTKVVPKELLPLGAKPIIHWIADEAAAAKVEELIIIIRADKPAIRDYFTPAPELSSRLGRRGKQGLLADLETLCRQLRFVFIEQDEPRGLGDAVLQAAPYIDDEPVLVLLGDAPIRAELPVSAQLQAVYQQTGSSVIGLESVPDETVPSRGIVSADREGEHWRLRGIVEKPLLAAAPSNLAVSGRYLLTPQVFDFLRRTKPGRDGEIGISDAIAELIAAESVYGCEFCGERFDTGTPAGYLAAMQAYL